MYGSDGAWTPGEILRLVLDDLDKEELDARRSGSAAITGILIAQKIVKKHIAKGYS